MLLRVQGERDTERRQGFETLARRYWEPIRSYARSAWARTDDDANDLTQDFFVWLVQSDVLRKYAPERGSFRHFLKGLLRNFGRHARRSESQRLAGKAPRSLAEAGIEEPADPHTAEAEEAFDRAWAALVIRRALERVRARHTEGALTQRWRAYEEYELKPPAERPTYEALAEKLGVKKGDVRNHLFAVRESIRTEVWLELRETVTDESTLDQEWRFVIGG
jgi:RNA polymerase sigma-70 factor (ECF subfamily)